MSKLFVSVFIIALMLSASAALATGVDVSASKGSVNGYTTEDVSVDVVVKNLESKADTFTLSLFPPQLEKISASLGNFLVTLNPNEEKTVKLTFSIPIDATPGAIKFEVSAKSASDGSVNDTQDVILNVKRLTPVYIQNLDMDKYSANSGDKININAKVYNLDDFRSDKYVLKITISKGNSIVKAFDESLDSIGAKSSVNVVESFNLDTYSAPGSYVVDAELRDMSNVLRHSKSLNFNVNTITKDPTEYTQKSTAYSVLYSSVVIKVKNEGNIPLQSFTLTESIPKFAQSLFSPDIEPIQSTSVDNRVVYTWSVPSLIPGGEYTISYKITIWRIWIVIGLVSGIGYGAYRWLSKPRISKIAKHQGELTKGTEVVVLIELKNRALHEIKDVEVVDIIPQIARVVDRFDTLRPRAKKVVGGIELRWNFDSMKPGEERVITYRIKPVVDVIGTLNLPEAQMIYMDRHKVRRTSISKQALTKAE
ncbi:MAG: hypothetical protein HYW23_00890 [Candidatus Aenigmarchaeota archaeon]|nr:hypothetical protein [Candidatus Aenigmarchaeota archaeon]